MSCLETQEILSAYIDGEINEKQQKLVSDHLKDCKRCRQLYEELLAVSNLFSDVAIEEPPDDLVTNIMSQISMIERDQKVVKLQKKKKVGPSWQWRKIAAGLAIFFISLAVGILPLITHNLAMDSPLELLQNETQNEVARDEGPLVKSKSEDSINPEGSKADQEVGIMSFQAQNEESGGSEESPENFESRTIVKTDDQILESENQGIVGIIGITNLVFSLSGSVLGLLLIWFARPSKK